MTDHIAEIERQRRETAKHYPDEELLRANIAAALYDVEVELRRALSLHAPQHSGHEGLSVIREEYLELEQEVFLKAECRSSEAMHEEAIQLAAMALRFVIDVTKPVQEIPAPSTEPARRRGTSGLVAHGPDERCHTHGPHRADTCGRKRAARATRLRAVLEVLGVSPGGGDLYVGRDCVAEVRRVLEDELTKLEGTEGRVP